MEISQMPKHKVIQCPDCGRPQVVESMHYITCKYCNKKSAIRRQGQWAVRIVHCISALEASEVCRKWSMALGFQLPQKDLFTAANMVEH